MSLNLSFINLYLDNLGTSFENLLNFVNLITYKESTHTFNSINNYINLLNLWPTKEQYTTIANNVLLIVYFSNSYSQALKTVFNEESTIWALDYLHGYYLRKLIHTTYLSVYSSSSLVLSKPIVINTHLHLFFFDILNKWTYAILTFGIAFYLTHIMKFRYQYGFNFYFNYFKTLSDLGEQEYGAYDDFKFFLFVLVQMLLWYCWIFFIGYLFSLQTETKLILMTLSVITSILLLPIRMLWDFGLSFGMYIRGAGSSSNIIIEIFFDIIGVVIIFTRFFVQNIRFVMVFVAFFELFEWSFSSLELNYILQFNINFLKAINLHENLTFEKLLSFFILAMKVCVMYFYHLLHLIIVSFMQIGVYLMVSFWLFFFLYTSFFKMASDTYFYSKKI